MNESVLLILIASIGSGALAALALGMGFNKTRSFDNEEQARALARPMSDQDTIEALALTQDRRFALWRTQSHAIGLAFFLGDKLVTRTLKQTDLKRKAERLIEIDCADIGFPKRVLETEPEKLDTLLGPFRTLDLQS